MKKSVFYKWILGNVHSKDKQDTIDAKSILGMLALGGNHIMKMDIHSDKADDLLRDVSRFLCREYGEAV